MPAWPTTIDTLNTDILRTMHGASTSAPADPTGVTGATALMLGLAVLFTPSRTGRVLIIVTGRLSDNTTADAASFILRYGTGAAPANQASVTGTTRTPTRTFTALTGSTSDGFAQVDLIDSLTLNTEYWFDYSAVATGAGAVANMAQLRFVILEI